MTDALDAMQRGERGTTTRADGGEPLVQGPAKVLDGILPERRVRRMKFSYTAGWAQRQRLRGLIVGDVKPEPGDVVVARVDQIGQHKRLELRSGRRALLYPEDEIVLSYADRYAPDAFEAEIPDDLSPCHLVAAGGIASRVLSRHVSFAEPTSITPVGLLAKENGDRLNLADWALGAPRPVPKRQLSIAVIGSAMNAGKTTTAANLVKGLVSMGREVGAAKVTGTGAGRDVWFLTDSGAEPVLDFTSVGLPSTYHAGQAEVERVFTQLHGHLAAAGVDAMVLEVADGIQQCETAALLRSQAFAERVDGVIFAAGDALGAAAAVDHARNLDLQRVAISGRVSASPLAAREAARATGLPVLDVVGLRDPGELLPVLPRQRQPVTETNLEPMVAASA
jgi:molybdopterin-guanine dinucleotide biosynthesis protein